jgi:Tfp pilus assembly protein PilZ
MIKLLKSRSMNTLLLVGRRFTRYPKKLTAQLFIKKSSDPNPCVVRDLSRGGACIEFDNAQWLRVGDEISLTLRIKNHGSSLVLDSKVAWLDRQNGSIGIEFDHPISEEEAA